MQSKTISVGRGIMPMERIHNFGAGPAVLPLSVVEECRTALPNLNGSGFGLLEISHRSQVFQEVVDSAMAGLRRVLGVPEDYTVLFLQGGASLQFFMTALNLLGEGEQADYLTTGGWSEKALKEAQRVGDAISAWDPSEGEFKRVPKNGEYSIRQDAVYVHYTSNNTLYGTQYHHLPDSDGKPLILDASSDIAGVPIDISAHDLVYAGAQKNLGPSGVTVVILSPWALSKVGNDLPTMLDYSIHASKGSLFNTPNTFGIFVLDRVFNWLEENGGLEASIARNKAKSDLLYGELDRTDFWVPHADKDSRSVMNVTWRMANESLEPVFLAEAEVAGLVGLKGHRSVGGIRASMYNGCPLESVETLVAFMREFESRNS
jgi:phosphoserine aminotransferase